MRRPPEAITFDFHNTLARCDEWFQLEIRDLVPAFLSWHANHGGTAITEATLDQSVTLYREIRRGVMHHGNEVDAVACVTAVTRQLGFGFDATLIERGICEVMRATLDDSSPMSGVVAAVRALRQAGIPLGVVSSAVYHPFLEWSLEKFGILPAFDTIVTSASSGYYKSRTEIYETALRDLGAIPEHTVHVGDSHRFDVATAGKLGMPTVWLDLKGEADQAHQADVVVTTLDGIDRLLLNGFAERSP